MRRIALVPIVLLALAGAALAVTGCGGGGGSTDPEEAIHAAAEHRDHLEGELLLAEVELDQAFLRQDEKEAVDEPRKAARAISRDLGAARW